MNEWNLSLQVFCEDQVRAEANQGSIWIFGLLKKKKPRYVLDNAVLLFNGKLLIKSKTAWSKCCVFYIFPVVPATSLNLWCSLKLTSDSLLVSTFWIFLTKLDRFVSFRWMSQLYLEASRHRLCSGHVWSAGSPPSHPGRRWVNSFSVPCVFTEEFARSLAHPSFRLSEAKAFSCFTQLMKRMNQNFPHGGAMDTHFANMRSLIQVSQPQQRSANITTGPIYDHSQSCLFFLSLILPVCPKDPGFWTFRANASERRLHSLLLLLPLVSPGL